MLHSLLYVALSNAAAALVLALAVAVLSRSGSRPALIHALWVLVLLKLVTPPVIHVPLPWPTPNLAALLPSTAEPVEAGEESPSDASAERAASPTPTAAAARSEAPGVATGLSTSPDPLEIVVDEQGAAGVVLPAEGPASFWPVEQPQDTTSEPAPALLAVVYEEPATAPAAESPLASAAPVGVGEGVSAGLLLVWAVGSLGAMAWSLWRIFRFQRAVLAARRELGAAARAAPHGDRDHNGRISPREISHQFRLVVGRQVLANTGLPVIAASPASFTAAPRPAQLAGPTWFQKWTAIAMATFPLASFWERPTTSNASIKTAMN